jgi:hypothetical protein
MCCSLICFNTCVLRSISIHHFFSYWNLPSGASICGISAIFFSQLAPTNLPKPEHGDRADFLKFIGSALGYDLEAVHQNGENDKFTGVNGVPYGTTLPTPPPSDHLDSPVRPGA